ncbi:hypothetical protein Tco_1156078 [Tanacetum coccineum]
MSLTKLQVSPMIGRNTHSHKRVARSFWWEYAMLSRVSLRPPNLPTLSHSLSQRSYHPDSADRLYNLAKFTNYTQPTTNQSPAVFNATAYVYPSNSSRHDPYAPLKACIRTESKFWNLEIPEALHTRGLCLLCERITAFNLGPSILLGLSWSSKSGFREYCDCKLAILQLRMIIVHGVGEFHRVKEAWKPVSMWGVEMAGKMSLYEG